MIDQLKEAAEYITPHLKAGLDPYEIADHVMRNSDGPDTDGRWYLEIPARWTKDGNPLPFSISAPPT